MTQKNENENEDNNKISNIKFITLIVVFTTIYLLLSKRKDKISENLNKMIVRSFFVYLIKSVLTKFLLNDNNIKIISKKNIITILISVITMALFLLFDESNIII